MTFEGNGGDGGVPPRRSRPHYHGDEVRGLFMVGALLVIFAESTGAALPLSTFGAVVSAVALVIAAGITNPKQDWIHWVNASFAVLGTLIFGTSAVTRYRAGTPVFDPSFIYVEAIALLSLVTLYYATRTVRGIMLRPQPE